MEVLAGEKRTEKNIPRIGRKLAKFDEKYY